MMKKLFSLVLAVMLILAMPLGVLADDGETTPAFEEPAAAPPAPIPDPTQAPTEAPAPPPTEAPTAEPTQAPAEAPTQEPVQEPGGNPGEEPAQTADEEPEEEAAALPAPTRLCWSEAGDLSFHTVTPETGKYIVTIYLDGKRIRQIALEDVPEGTPGLTIPADQVLSGAGEYVFEVVAVGFDGWLDSEAALSPPFLYEPEDPYAGLDPISTLAAMAEAGEITATEARDALLAMSPREIAALLLDSQDAVDALGALEALYMRAAGITLNVDAANKIKGAQLTGAGLNAWESPQALRAGVTAGLYEEGFLHLSFALEAIQPAPNPPKAYPREALFPVYVTLPMLEGFSGRGAFITEGGGEAVSFRIRDQRICFVITSLGQYRFTCFEMPEIVERADLAKIEAFVKRLYQNVMGRPADAAGLKYWRDNLVSGAFTGAYTCGWFYTSPEFTNLSQKMNDEQFITNLYNNCMGRAPDAAGIAFWKTKLNAGATRISIMAWFVTSPEFSGICQSYGISRGSYNPSNYRDKNMNITMFVTRLYRTFMGRQPDTGGLEYWCKSLIQGTITGNQTAADFVFSPEFVGMKLADAQFVERMYLGMMGRPSDAGGMAYWLGNMQGSNGLSRGAVFYGFLDSPEWKGILASYGLSWTGFPAVPTMGGKHRALLIGNTYSGASALIGPATDIVGMQSMLGRMTQTPYSVTRKRDQTASQILSSITSAFSGATADDVSLFYYSGHGSTGGVLVGNDFYGISPASLRTRLDTIQGKKIVIVDACNSGGIIGKTEAEQKAAAKQASDSFVNSFINEFAKGERNLAASNYYVITAAHSSEYSWEGSVSGTRVGFFTYALCHGSGWNYATGAATAFPADSNKDRKLSLQEVYIYARNLAGSYVSQSAQVYPANSSFVLYGY